jgi:hypothetical protein
MFAEKTPIRKIFYNIGNSEMNAGRTGDRP